MNRLLTVVLLVTSANVWAQTKPNADQNSSEAKPSESFNARIEREQLKREVMDDVRKALEKQKDEVRDEVRAQVATQTTNRALEEEYQFRPEKKKLELFELNGYLRVRPVLNYQLNLQRGLDPDKFKLYGAASSNSKTEANANMRWRLEPTLNVSEDVRIRSQIDVFDNLVLGSTPSGSFGLSQYDPFVLSGTQTTVTSDRNWINSSILVRRAYGEVNTPLGQFLFGRMGSQWGLGMLTSSGNCVDCDYGDTVDRLAFVAKVAGFYVVPMYTFDAVGPTSINGTEAIGQPYDLDQLDDAHDYGIAIAKRDTDLEISHKLAADQKVFNYGVYFTWRKQANTANTYYSGDNPYSGTNLNTTGNPYGFIGRDANIFIPDLWFKFQTKKLRLELEAAAVLGKMNAFNATDNARLTLEQFGGVAQADYKALDSLSIQLEAGFASGDKAYGMGNLPGRNGGAATQKRSIDGAQYNLSSTARDTNINNFRFNRDYRIDLILWREIYNGITDAIYVKPGLKWEITDGLGLWTNLIYSRAVYSASTPSANNPNLGVELDGGLRYDSGDGFLLGVSYGVLFPLAGLNNTESTSLANAQTAQSVRGWFVIKY